MAPRDVWKRKITDAQGMKGVPHFLSHPPAGPQEAALDTQVYYFMRTLIGTID